MSEVPLYQKVEALLLPPVRLRYKGTSLIRNAPTHQDHYKALGIILL